MNSKNKFYGKALFSLFLIFLVVSFFVPVVVEATNERTGGVISETTGSDGNYSITFGGPVYVWEVGDVIKLRAKGTGNNECLEGEREVTISSGGLIKVDIPLHLSINADFSFSPENPVAGGNVTFSDLSTGTVTNRTWDFGDGNISYEKNPVHVYEADGNYTVTITIYCHSFTDTKSLLLHVEKQESNNNSNSDNTNGTGNSVGSTPGFLFTPIIFIVIILLAIFKKRNDIDIYNK